VLIDLGWRLGAPTGAQTDAEIARSAGINLSQPALPDAVPPAAPAADRRTPASPAAQGRPASAWCGAPDAQL